MATLRNPDLEPAHPGEVVAEVIKALGSNVDLMAAQLNASRETLIAVVEGRSALTREIAKQFEFVTGTSADLLTRMQSKYDEWEMRTK